MEIELYFERIEQYESAAMSAADRSAFEADLASNEALRQAHALYLQSNAVIEQGIENKLRGQLQSWAAEDAGKEPVAKTTKVVSMGSYGLRLAIAAGFALLIGWFGWQWAGAQYADESLYAANYQMPAELRLRASGQADAHPLQPGFDAFNENNWQVASDFFSRVDTDNERYSEAQYYLGHAALQAKNYSAAINAFQIAAQDQQSKFKEKAEWNLLLAYVAAGRSEEPVAQDLLKRLAAAPDHSYFEQAKQLQNKLGAFWRRIVQ